MACCLAKDLDFSNSVTMCQFRDLRDLYLSTRQLSCLHCLVTLLHAVWPEARGNIAMILPCLTRKQQNKKEEREIQSVGFNIAMLRVCKKDSCARALHRNSIQTSRRTGTFARRRHRKKQNAQSFSPTLSLRTDY